MHARLLPDKAWLLSHHVLKCTCLVQVCSCTCQKENVWARPQCAFSTTQITTCLPPTFTLCCYDSFPAFFRVAWPVYSCIFFDRFGCTPPLICTRPWGLGASGQYSIQIMQEPRHEPSSYFTFSKPPESSSQSSTPVSPGTSVHDPPPSRSSLRPPVRKPPTPRSVTDYLSYRPTLISQTIEEDAVNKVIVPVDTAHRTLFEGSRSPSDAAKRPGLFRRSASSARTSPPGTGTISHERTIRPPNGLGAATKPSYGARPGHVWTRTSSGSVWYERLRGSSSHSKQSSDPSSGSRVPKQLLTPLKPPSSPSGSPGPPYQHQVRVEKSFSNVRGEKSPSVDQGRSRTSAATESRRGSINPLKMFSAPLEQIRKFSLTKHKSKPKVQANDKSPTPHHAVEMRGHRSLLKRTRTADALRQVTSILHDTAIPSGACSPVTVISPLRSRQMSDRSASSRGSDSGRQHKQQLKASKSPVDQSYKRSTHDLLEAGNSFTTSQWELSMGVRPNNTPDERATYRVKRSPSAESEEFLKVDISIHGGTSSLPSEARRIHTPPFPQEGADGRRRGFFFDYNAPRTSNGPDTSPKAAPGLKLPAHIGVIPRRSTSQVKTVHEQTFSASPKSVRQEPSAARAKKSDWYDVKLAELDTSSDEDDDIDPTKRPGQARGRSMTNKSGKSLAKCKRKKEEEMLDYNIPEHLPNSPLCPRHPRYWRVVQGRGSSFRGCWMHGVGPWEKGEGRVAGVSPA